MQTLLILIAVLFASNNTIAKLGISSTPTLVMPDGLIVPGYKTADALLTLIRQNVAQVVVQ